MNKKRFDILYTPSGRAGEYANHGYAANLYNHCPNGCAYCYVPACLRMTPEQFNQESVPKRDVLNRLYKDLQKAGKLDEPIFLNFTHDPYPPVEKKLKITRSAIELIKDAGNNVRILTKNGDLAQRDFGLLDSNDEFGVSLTTIDYESLKMWEPNAGTPHARMGAIIEAKRKGIKTWVSCEPVLRPEWTIEMIRQIAPDADLVKVGVLNYSNTLPDHLKAQLKPVDWKQFAIDVTTLCESLGVNYVLKQDLKKYLEATR
jgi:DNA repair photolyase